MVTAHKTSLIHVEIKKRHAQAFGKVVCVHLANIKCAIDLVWNDMIPNRSCLLIMKHKISLISKLILDEYTTLVLTTFGC